MKTMKTDQEILDWLDEFRDRLLDVRGHLNNEECCETVRDAAVHMRRIQEAHDAVMADAPAKKRRKAGHG